MAMLYLLSQGARYNYVSITTTDLGRAIHRSQQATSKYLLELEQNRLIDRVITGRRVAVRITPRGYSKIVRLGSMIQKGINSDDNVLVRGTVASGMGEGAYYMSLEGYTKQFKNKIGYVPFPGTLNIKLSDPIYQQTLQQFNNMSGVMIDGFSDDTRTFGWVKCFAALVNSVNCQMIILERTHHDESIIELISDVCIRETARLDDGSKVTVRIATNHNP